MSLAFDDSFGSNSEAVTDRIQKVQQVRSSNGALAIWW